MKWVKRVGLVVLVAMIGGAAYVYNRVSPPSLPDPSNAVENLANGPTGRVTIKSKSPYNMSVLLNHLEAAPDIALPVDITLPTGASAEKPVPAMVIIHGSGGIAEGREKEYAKFLAVNGIASLVMHYYDARGVDLDAHYMSKVMSTTEVDLIVDAYASLKALGTHPAIDAARIGVMGFSYGGMATRYTINKQMKDLLAPDALPFAAHIDLYGPCHQSLITPKTTGAAYLSLRGKKDASIDHKVCADVEAILSENGAKVQTHIYETAGHAWESTRTRKLYEDAPYVVGDCRFGYTKEGQATINGYADDGAEPAIDASRTTRAFKRVGIQVSASHCIKYGYIMGEDIQTRDDAYKRIINFLQESFSMNLSG